MILVIDNKIDPPYGSADIVRYTSGEPVVVKRGPDGALPTKIDGISHLILSGSKTSCLSDEPWVHSILKLIQMASEKSVPILGICFGHQMLARSFGGLSMVRRSATPEFGWIRIERTNEGEKDPLLNQLPNEFFSYASHQEEVAQIPPGFVVTAKNERCAIQAMRSIEKPIFGVQFHPERNAEEGQRSLEQVRAATPPEALFNDGKSFECYNQSIVRQVFSAFLNLK